MYIGYLNDRKGLGFSCIKDIRAAKLILNLKKFLKRTKRVSVAYLIEKGKQVCILIFSKEVLVAVFIFLKSSYIEPNVEPPPPSFILSEVYQSCVSKSNNLRFLTSPSQILDSILKLRGGFDELNDEEQEKLVKSIIAKTPQSLNKEISINKFLEKILKLIDPVISDQRFWRLISELQKTIKSELSVSSEVRSTDILAPSENAKENQAKTGSKGSSSIFVEALSNPTTLSPMQKRVQRNRALNLAKKEPTLTPTMLKASKVPTPDLFSADSVTGDIQNINIAFNQFKQRMTQIGNQYAGEKQEYFFEQLNQCEIDRFKALSTEKGKITIYNVREAETMLQSEFEGFHEPNSITRPTKAEFQEGNVLDGRFRKGMLSGESNTLNEQYTDVDAKLLVSDKTLQHQADKRRILGHKNPNKMSMYEQGKDMGSSIVVQKHKHCNPNKPELPSSPDNLKHIINAFELIPSETEIAKAGVLDGARIAWSDKLNVPESSISDQTALQGIIFLNEDCTIERVN